MIKTAENLDTVYIYINSNLIDYLDKHKTIFILCVFVEYKNV